MLLLKSKNNLNMSSKNIELRGLEKRLTALIGTYGSLIMTLVSKGIILQIIFLILTILWLIRYIIHTMEK